MQHFIKLELDNYFNILTVFKVFLCLRQCVNNQNKKTNMTLKWCIQMKKYYFSGGGPIHASVPIHAHPQFSLRFVLSHGKDVYHIIDNYQIDDIHR